MISREIRYDFKRFTHHRKWNSILNQKTKEKKTTQNFLFCLSFCDSSPNSRKNLFFCQNFGADRTHKFRWMCFNRTPFLVDELIFTSILILIEIKFNSIDQSLNVTLFSVHFCRNVVFIAFFIQFYWKIVLQMNAFNDHCNHWVRKANSNRKNQFSSKSGRPWIWKHDM